MAGIVVATTPRHAVLCSAGCCQAEGDHIQLEILRTTVLHQVACVYFPGVLDVDLAG